MQVCYSQEKIASDLINVAITRTKGKFIHVCDTEFVKKNVYRSKTLRQLVEYQIDKGQMIQTNEVGNWIKASASKVTMDACKKN